MRCGVDKVWLIKRDALLLAKFKYRKRAKVTETEWSVMDCYRKWLRLRIASDQMCDLLVLATEQDLFTGRMVGQNSN